MLKYILFGILISGIISAAAIIKESIKENRLLEISSYDIHSKKIQKPVRIVLLADLHNSEFGPENRTLLKKIQLLEPDVVLVAGDILVGKPGRPVDIAISFLNRLGSEYKVFVGKGNHELRTSLYTDKYGDMWERLYTETKNSVTWLINECYELPEYSVCIYGLDMDAEYYKRFKTTPMKDDYLKKTLPAIRKNRFNILIAHHPDYFEEYADWGADLCVSGHVHGGLIILPKIGGLVSPMVTFFPKLYKGLYQKGKSGMVVSGGLGNHTFKIRVNNKPDLVVINVKK